MRIIKEGWPWVWGALLAGILAALACRLAGWAGGMRLFVALGVSGAGFMAFFHRHPRRRTPTGSGNIWAGADGVVRRVEHLREEHILRGDAVRISIYLSPLDVHINRAPVSGRVSRLEYTPGRHLLARCDRASEINEHSSILVENPRGFCMVRQIVGPVVRRVVHWLTIGQDLTAGQPLGMMRFGSRLDMYLPAGSIETLVVKGDRVRAGETAVARWVEKGEP